MSAAFKNCCKVVKIKAVSTHLQRPFVRREVDMQRKEDNREQYHYRGKKQNRLGMFPRHREK